MSGCLTANSLYLDWISLNPQGRTPSSLIYKTYNNCLASTKCKRKLFTTNSSIQEVKRSHRLSNQFYWSVFQLPFSPVLTDHLCCFPCIIKSDQLKKSKSIFLTFLKFLFWCISPDLAYFLSGLGVQAKILLTIFTQPRRPFTSTFLPPSFLPCHSNSDLFRMLFNLAPWEEIFMHPKIQFSGTFIAWISKVGHQVRKLGQSKNCSFTWRCSLHSSHLIPGLQIMYLLASSSPSLLLVFQRYLTPAAVVGARRRQQLSQTLNFTLLCNSQISPSNP